MAQPQRSEAYTEGRRAYRLGEANQLNPHGSGGARDTNAKRIDWFDGWYDAKHEAMFPHLFAVAEGD